MKSRYFFGAAIVFGVIGIWQVSNHQHDAAALTSTIITKDTNGLDTANDQVLLKDYTAAHMYTAQQVTLNGSYNRAVAAAKTAANPSANSQIYPQAQAACSGQTNSVAQSNCISTYITTHSAAGANPQAALMPNKVDFVKSYTSPSWTPDSAGIWLLAALASFALGVYLFIIRRF